ncbi:phage portal protein [Nocardiopsis sp. YSL2]|uniref:phage portal protein n=1 Tax=Nocardiopsis sp. YSL2 TaxID=2939492 RepID=UPI0026F40D82|nr:phage portal protein [Nocardiopsis sp. YSL2]
MGEAKENHPLRAACSRTRNPILSEFELFELTVIHMMLAGTAFWEIVRDQAGRPVQLWPLRPDLVRFWLQPKRPPAVRVPSPAQAAGSSTFGEDVIANSCS